MTKSTVNASRLRVIRFAQFIASLALHIAIATHPHLNPLPARERRTRSARGGCTSVFVALAKPRLLPNRHLLLQLGHYPLTRTKRFLPMRAAHPQKQRWFARCDKTDPVMKDHVFKPKFPCGLFGDPLQLVLCHLPMGFIIDSVDLAPILQPPDHTPKIDCCSRIAIVVLRRRL